MSFLQLYGIAAVVILVFMTLVWILSLILRDSSIVDIFWGLGFVLVAWVYFLLTPGGFVQRRLLVGSMVTVWGLRLSLHILWRNWGKGEDFRYAKWRQEAGPNWWWLSYLRVFLLQGLIMWIVSAPLMAAQISPTPERLTFLDWAGVLVWVIGFFFEAGGDWQLARFKSDPANKGKLLTRGVWRYSRHPNYFGDAMQWWGFYLVAAAATGGFWTVFSPILMTVLLLRVSGVTLLEETLKETKPGYEEYTRTTSAFVPWFPRRKTRP